MSIPLSLLVIALIGLTSEVASASPRRVEANTLDHSDVAAPAYGLPQLSKASTRWDLFKSRHGARRAVSSMGSRALLQDRSSSEDPPILSRRSLSKVTPSSYPGHSHGPTYPPSYPTYGSGIPPPYPPPVGERTISNAALQPLTLTVPPSPPLTPGTDQPVAPKAPFNPLAPMAPWAPSSPNAPLTPNAPAWPRASPSTPLNPDTPASPSSPPSPNTPGSPKMPESPNAPLSPNNPASPYAPASPQTPESPRTPFSPKTPASPSTPLVPNPPAHPSTPIFPSPPPSPNPPVYPNGPLSPSMPLSPSAPFSPQNPPTPQDPSTPWLPLSPRSPFNPRSPRNPTPRASPPPVAVAQTNVGYETVALHNSYRANHNAPPIVWDTKLAVDAQGWADKCSFSHSSLPWWENIGMGTNLLDIIGMFYGEVCLYDFSNPGFSLQTGHFTTVVWASMISIGCGLGDCPNGSTEPISGRNWRAPTFVCEYKSRGGSGSFSTNVLPPITPPSMCNRG
eukprot:gene24826-10477_t